MKGLGEEYEAAMDQLPIEAQRELIKKVHISSQSRASSAGAVLMGMHILEYVGFPRYIDEILGEEHMTIEQLRFHWHNRAEGEEALTPSKGIVLSLLVADMIASPRNITPAYHFEDMAEQWCTGPLLGIEPSYLNDDRIGRAMSDIAVNPHNLQEVLYSLIFDTVKKEGIPLNKFIADTTTLQLDGAFNDAPKVVPGRGTDSFSQLILSLVIASGSKLPIGFNTLAGNTSDCSTLPDVYEKINKVADEGAVELLFDRIYPTPSNINYLKDHEDERMVYWVSPLKMGHSKKRVRELIDTAYREELWEPISYRSTKEINANVKPPLSAFEATWTLTEKIKPDLEPGQTRRPRGSITTIHTEVRAVFYRHEKKAKKEQEKRETKIQQLDKELQKFHTKLNKWNYRELDYCEKKLVSLLKSFGNLKNFLQYDFSQSDGIIDLTWSWDEASIEVEKKYDGIFALLTNYPQEKVDSDMLVTKYRSRDQVEVNFKDLRGILQLERILYRLPERIDAYIFLKVIAYFVLAFLRFFAQKEGVKTTEKKIQESMGDLLLVESTILPLGLNSYSIARDTELNQLLRKKFSLPDPEELIQVLSEAENAKAADRVFQWYEEWKKSTGT